MTDSNLKLRFQTELQPALGKALGITNPWAIPRPVKVVLNIGIPKSDSSKSDLKNARAQLAVISGQTPKISGAKRAIAGFKVREGDPIGVSVNLRGQRMFDFLDKLCRIVLPQVKDFRGVKLTAFDGHGNYTLGLTEQIIFPEIEYAKIDKVRGLEVTIVTSTSNDAHARKLLELIGLPFEKQKETSKNG